MPDRLDPVDKEIMEVMKNLTPKERDRLIQDFEEIESEEDDFGEVAFFGYYPEYSTTKDFEFEE